MALPIADQPQEREEEAKCGTDYQQEIEKANSSDTKDNKYRTICCSCHVKTIAGIIAFIGLCFRLYCLFLLLKWRYEIARMKLPTNGPTVMHSHTPGLYRK